MCTLPERPQPGEPEKTAPVVDYHELMRCLSRPRPNGSQAERQTAQRLRNWLAERGIPFRVHSFRHYPYFFEAVGAWLILSRSLLAAAIWLRWGWAAMPLALLGLAGGFLDTARHLPLVTWPGVRRGENLVIEFEPPRPPQQEILISAHYDSKTELLDHRQRMPFVRNLPAGIFLTLLLGLAGPLDAFLLSTGSPWAALVHGAGVALSLPLLFLAWGLGLNLALGRLVEPSQGAVDDGSACAIVLGLAERLHRENPARETRLTLALFTGEEVNMQGSRAYARDREWPLPAVALNLEIMAQDGEYVYWEQDGNAFGLAPTCGPVNEALRAAVAQVTGRPPLPAGPINSDGSSFLAAGVPTTVLGTYDRRLGDSGFHRPSDNLGRVMFERLPEGVEILFRFIQWIDTQPGFCRQAAD